MVHPLREWIETTFESLGAPGIFVLAFFDSSLLSLPEVNDIVLFVKCSGAGWLAALYAFAATMGSASGCSLLYVIGRRSGEALVRRLASQRFAAIKRVVARYGVYSVLIPSVLPPPLPFKIFVLSAGVFGLPYRSFILVILLGRSLRYFSEAAAAVFIGEPALAFFKAHPYTIAGAAIVILAIGIAAQYGIRVALRRHGVIEE